MFIQKTTKKTRKIFTIVSLFIASLSITNTASATIVAIKTSLSAESIEVNLFDKTTPETVRNFLSYVDNGHYTNSLMHRVVPDFIAQGGGFEFTGNWPLTAIPPNAPIINEPFYSNVKGTIAMAKKSGNQNSATDQWFFNLADNSENLDRQNGGFTAFGQVIKGMDIIERIALLKLCIAGDFEGIPLILADGQNCADLTVPGIENFVVIESVTIIDSSEVTDSGLHPLLTKFPDSDGDGVKDIDDAFPSDPNKYLPDSEESGGSIAWLTLVMLTLITARKRITTI